MQLQSGQNIPLHTTDLTLRLDYLSSFSFRSEPETCLFMLNADGKVTGDADFIFYNNRSAAGGGVKLVPGHQHANLQLALDRIPETIQKIAITLVIDGNDTISGLSQLRLTATGIAEFNVDLKGRTEKAVIMGEIYRHQGQWKPGRKGRGLTVDWSHWPSAMVSMSHNQKIPHRNRPGSVWRKSWKESTRAYQSGKKASISLAKHKLETVEARVAFCSRCLRLYDRSV